MKEQAGKRDSPSIRQSRSQNFLPRVGAGMPMLRKPHTLMRKSLGIRSDLETHLIEQREICTRHFDGLVL